MTKREAMKETNRLVDCCTTTWKKHSNAFVYIFCICRLCRWLQPAISVGAFNHRKSRVKQRPQRWITTWERHRSWRIIWVNTLAVILTIIPKWVTRMINIYKWMMCPVPISSLIICRKVWQKKNYTVCSWQLVLLNPVVLWRTTKYEFIYLLLQLVLKL